MPGIRRIRRRAALLAATGLLAAAPAAGSAESLTVRVLGVEPATGDVHVALYDDPETFPKSGKMRVEQEVVADGPAAEVVFEGLQPGRRYAVAVYHDADGNDEFDQGILGIPRERYGFSRNPRVFLRAPRFDEAAVTLPPDGATVEIDLAR